MNRQQAVEHILTSGGKIVSLAFIKRSTQEEREMVCRVGVWSRVVGGEPAYDPEQHGLIRVFDMLAGQNQKNGWRSVPIEGITRVKVDGVWHHVSD